jgi:hypothetical protein
MAGTESLGPGHWLVGLHQVANVAFSTAPRRELIGLRIQVTRVRANTC